MRSDTSHLSSPANMDQRFAMKSQSSFPLSPPARRSVFLESSLEKVDLPLFFYVVVVPFNPQVRPFFGFHPFPSFSFKLCTRKGDDCQRRRLSSYG